MQMLTHSQLVSAAFAVALVASFALKLWLATRQIRHVAAHADQVPESFAKHIDLPAHRKAAAYTLAKQRLSIIEIAWSTALLAALTLGGGLQWVVTAGSAALGTGLMFQVGLVALVLLLLTLTDLPFAWYRTFHIEQRFGFNRTTPGLFFTDLLKSLVLSAMVGLPILTLVLWLMGAAGPLWWVYAWVAWTAFNLMALIVYPTLIAPWFNQFKPLPEGELLERIQALLARAGFASRGVFVMDGSRRSAHGNAYFTGLGAAKRVVFFDTLIERLSPSEIEAVLAHELGHFKLKHIAKRLALLLIGSLIFFAALGWLAGKTWFYQGLGVEPILGASNDGLALILFILILPVILLPLGPLANALSRKHEFEADAYAAGQSQRSELIKALVKLYQDNASTLTPDPLYSIFYSSHPPARARIARLQASTQR